MATSFTRTREEMCDIILRKLGVGAIGQAPAPEDSAVVYEGMDLRLKELHALGILWWQVAGATTNVTLVGGTTTATITPTDFLFPVTMALRVDDEDFPIEIIGHREYQAIQDKSSTGEPNKVFISGSTAYFYPTPDTAYTAKLTYQAIADDTAASTAPDVPVACMRAFGVLVASDLADDFSLPEQKVQRLLAQSAMSLRTIQTLNAQRVDTTTVTPEYF